MTRRDPKLKPMPDDEFFRPIPTAKGGGIIRTVTRSHGGFTFFKQDNGYTVKRRMQPTKDFCKWASASEVIQRVD